MFKIIPWEVDLKPFDFRFDPVTTSSHYAEGLTFS